MSSNIIYSPGMIYIHHDDDSEIVFNCTNTTLEFTEECDETPLREEIKTLMATEATFECNNVKIHRQLWYRLAYGSPWQWPVSNNWLKSHGYNMRRCKQIRKVLSWLWMKYIKEYTYGTETENH